MKQLFLFQCLLDFHQLNNGPVFGKDTETILNEVFATKNTNVTITGGNGASLTANTASTVTYKGAAATSTATTITVKVTPTDTTNYNSVTKTYSVTIKKDIHINHMDYMETEEFKNLYKERYKIEAKNAELKNNYDYGNANACGKAGITIQGATTLFLSNMKRIIKLSEEKNKNID